MTPQEKAKELYERMYYKIPAYIDDDCEHQTAINCALIAVEEILKLNIDDDTGYLDTEQQTYWQEVKQEIEEL